MAKNNWFSFRNPAGIILKQHLFEILQERFLKHEELIERIGLALQTEKDLQLFGNLVADIYEVGYMKATSDYKQELSKLGYNVKITPPNIENKDNKIFK